MTNFKDSSITNGARRASGKAAEKTSRNELLEAAASLSTCRDELNRSKQENEQLTSENTSLKSSLEAKTTFSDSLIVRVDSLKTNVLKHENFVFSG